VRQQIAAFDAIAAIVFSTIERSVGLYEQRGQIRGVFAYRATPTLTVTANWPFEA